MFHFPCADGFGSAVVAYMARPDVEFIPVNHKDIGNLGSRLHDKRVLFVDIAPTYEHVTEWGMKDYLILDHHDTTEQEMKKIPRRHKVFDMSRSGVGLAHEYFFPGRRLPLILSFIEKNDLWQHKDIFNCEECLQGFHATYDYCVHCWVNAIYDECHEIPMCIEVGKVLLKQKRRKVSRYARHASPRNWQGFRVWVVNVTEHEYINDVGYEVVTTSTRHHDIALMWSYNAMDRTYLCSLRSLNRVGPHVGKLAEPFGGGGHPHSAGFCVQLESIESLFE